MSIVGTQSVSMSDLMKLGPQALGAMAQGQTQSIAPSYMVIAALKALTDQQKGMQSQVPGQTIKDQVVAQATPPQQAGIGAMAPPVQKFSGGGQPVGTEAVNAQIADYFRQRFGPAWDSFKEETQRGLAGRRQTEEDINYGHEGNRVATQATAPTGIVGVPPQERVGTEKGRATNTNPVVPQSGGSAAISSSTARSGIGGGNSLLEKYKDNAVKPKTLAEIEGLAISEDKFLNDAIDKYGKPDEKRMKELRDTEARTGILQFGAGMLEGGSFGDTFAKAVNKGNTAQQAEAEKRRTYEDKREAVATELGLKKGSREYENFFKNVEYKKGERDADLAAQKDTRDYGFKATQAKNEEALKQQQLAIQSEANRIAERVRVEGMDQRKLDNLGRLQQMAYETAQKVGKEMREDLTTAGMKQDVRERMIADAVETAYRKTFPKDVEAIMRKHLGVATGIAGTAAPSGGKVLGEMKR
jgi:hypothetical protein